MKVFRFRKWRLLFLTANQVRELDYLVTRLRDPDYPAIPCGDDSCGYTQCEFVKFLRRDK